MAAWLLSSVVPSLCHAEEESPSIVGYAFEGLGTGIATGLAIGYLSTGPEYHSEEWRKLVWGTAIGGLAGLGTGLVLGVADAASGPGRSYGFYMIRDSNYGVSVGFVAGAIVGVLIWIGDDNGSGKDLLRGMAWGTVIGAGAGLIMGVIEGALRSSSAPPPARTAALRSRRWQIGFGFTPSAAGAPPIPYPTLSGRF